MPNQPFQNQFQTGTKTTTPIQTSKSTIDLLKPIAKGAYQFAKDILIEAPARASGSVMLDILGKKQFQPQIGIEKFFLGEKPVEALSERIRKSIPVGEKIGGVIAGEPGRKIGKYVAPATVIGMTIADIMPVGGPAKKGAQEAAKEVLETTGKEISEQAVKETPRVFEGLKNVTTRLLERLKGLPEKIKPGRFEEIVAKTKKEGLKEVEEKLVRESLVFDERGMIDLPKTAAKVEEKLLPLTPKMAGTQFKYVGQEFLGGGKYGEIVYQSHLRTTAGRIHYTESDFPNYFSHVRYEDLLDGKTRKILEIQSDLFQKGRINEELDPNLLIFKEKPGAWYVRFPLTGDKAELKTTGPLSKGDRIFRLGVSGSPDLWVMVDKVLDEARVRAIDENGNVLIINVAKDWSDAWENLIKERNLMYEPLKYYDSSQPLVHLRTFREEVKRAAQDGKDTLLIPTAKTAMRAEGLTPVEKIDKIYDALTNEKLDLDSIMSTSSLGRIIALDREDPVFKTRYFVINEIYPIRESIKVAPLSDQIIRSIFGLAPHEEYSFEGIMDTFSLYPSAFEKWKELTKDNEIELFLGNEEKSLFFKKLYDEFLPKEARRMGLPVEDKIQLDNGEWWVIKIPPERAQMPVEAFGVIPFLPVISSQLIPERRNEQRKSTTIRKEVIQ
jgi:hypothetical protein